MARLTSTEAESQSDAQWPSVAYLYNKKTQSSCTVSILNSRWLITSYRCMLEK